jgi:hypothetical protein
MGKLSDEHYTPKWFFDQLSVEFDLDVAAPEGGLSWIFTKHYFTENDNGLAQPWQGKVWMNPPYSKVTPWVDRFIEHNNGIALLVVSKSKWFAKLWDKADAIIPWPSQAKFERPNDLKPISISFQTFLFALGDDNAKALKKMNARVR